MNLKQIMSDLVDEDHKQFMGFLQRSYKAFLKSTADLVAAPFIAIGWALAAPFLLLFALLGASFYLGLRTILLPLFAVALPFLAIFTPGLFVDVFDYIILWPLNAASLAGVTLAFAAFHLVAPVCLLPVAIARSISRGLFGKDFIATPEPDSEADSNAEDDNPFEPETRDPADAQPAVEVEVAEAAVEPEAIVPDVEQSPESSQSEEADASAADEIVQGAVATP